MTRLILVIILFGAVVFTALSLFLPGKEFFVQNPHTKFGIGAGIPPHHFGSQSGGGEPEPSPITLYFVGDIVLDRGVELMLNKHGQGDFKFPFAKIADELQKADILFGNLEGPISDRGMRVGSIYSFRFEPEAVEGLVYAGFDMLSLANNHMFDYQRVALEDTMTILEQNGIDYVGAGLDRTEAYSVKIKQVDNTRIGFLSYTNLGPSAWRAGPNYSGIAWIDEKDFEVIGIDIKNIKQIVDVLIVSLHGGIEYSPGPSRFQTAFAKACIEAGADLVVGHHPHVVQPVEQFKQGWVAYSLGNFVLDQVFSQETMQGLLLKVIIKNNKIDQVIPQTVKLNKYFQPEIFIDL